MLHIKKTIIFVIAITQVSCIPLIDTVNCIDGAIPRPTFSYKNAFQLSMKLNGVKFDKLIKCEHYYDGYCGARGNYWALRSVYENGISNITSTNGEPEVIVEMPGCNRLAKSKGELTIQDFIFFHGGSSLYQISADHPNYEYRIARRSDSPYQQVAFSFEWSVKIIPNSRVKEETK